MNLIIKNLKKAGIFNTVLIVIAILLMLGQMFSTDFKIAFDIFNFYYIFTIIALISGLIYALYGYKKDGAKYYKVFMILTFVTFVLSAISFLPYSYTIAIACLSFARIIPLSLLAFKKDFGVKKSIICAYIVFALTLAIVFTGPFVYITPLENIIALSLSNVLISAIVVVFVETKYADKEARGTI